MNNTSFNENMDILFTEVQDFAKQNSVMGAPLTVENKTLVPIVSVTLGYGSGTNSMKSGSNESKTPGVGLGAKISTDAVVVIDKDNVSMLPVTQKANANQLMDKIPQVISSMMPNAQQNMQQGAQQGQQPNQQAQQQNQQQAQQQNQAKPKP
ncbi:GerW family sporulation protein [Clostridium mobile]